MSPAGAVPGALPDGAVQVVAGAVVLFAVGAALWPPPGDSVYWAVLPVGGRATLLVVSLVAVGVGAVVGWATGIDLPFLAAGGAAAYLVGMRLVGAFVRPDSPVHLVAYGALLACLLLGAAVQRVA